MTQADDDAAVADNPPAAAGPIRDPAPGIPEQPRPGPPSGPPLYGPPSGPAGYGPAAYGPPYSGPAPQYGWRPPVVPLAPDGRPLADFGTRLLAHLIDSAILTAVAVVLFTPIIVFVLFRMMPDANELADPNYTPVPSEFFLTFLLIEAIGIVVLLIGYYFYFVEMMFRSGQTLGKKLMKVKVVPIQPGATLTRGMAAKRYLIEFIAGVVVPFFSYLDGLWQLWDKPYQQTLHDKVAGTVVVKVAP